MFGKNGEWDGEFINPGYFSVTPSNHLFVCDHNNHRVEVFELNGKFIWKFGTEGAKLGEFKKPLSVALLSNDRIVVADQYNHRIQIFE